ncbi:MAG: hypothetical protein HQM14_03660, partial [SAR324 cluster bacterium]|nr:hypothetical protein [SAR324 cluster bacterium]
MPHSVLVLEESALIQELIASALEDSSLTIHQEQQSDQFFKTAKQIVPDLIFISNSDHKQDYEVCRKFRNDADLEKTPLIILADSRDKLDENVLSQLNIDTHLRKPFEAAVLQEHVKQVIPSAFPVPAALAYQEAQSSNSPQQPLSEEISIFDDEMKDLIDNQSGEPAIKENDVPEVDFSEEVGNTEQLIDEELIGEEATMMETIVETETSLLEDTLSISEVPDDLESIDTSEFEELDLESSDEFIEDTGVEEEDVANLDLENEEIEDLSSEDADLELDEEEGLALDKEDADALAMGEDDSGDFVVELEEDTLEEVEEEGLELDEESFEDEMEMEEGLELDEESFEDEMEMEEGLELDEESFEDEMEMEEGLELDEDEAATLEEDEAGLDLAEEPGMESTPEKMPKEEDTLNQLKQSGLEDQMVQEQAESFDDVDDEFNNTPDFELEDNDDFLLEEEEALSTESADITEIDDLEPIVMEGIDSEELEFGTLADGGIDVDTIEIDLVDDDEVQDIDDIEEDFQNELDSESTDVRDLDSVLIEDEESAQLDSTGDNTLIDDGKSEFEDSLELEDDDEEIDMVLEEEDEIDEFEDALELEDDESPPQQLREGLVDIHLGLNDFKEELSVNDYDDSTEQHLRNDIIDIQLDLNDFEPELPDVISADDEELLEESPVVVHGPTVEMMEMDIHVLDITSEEQNINLDHPQDHFVLSDSETEKDFSMEEDEELLEEESLEMDIEMEEDEELLEEESLEMDIEMEEDEEL